LNKIYICKKLIHKRWRGMTIPPFGIFIRECCLTESLLKHEKAHWEQYLRMGLFMFYLNYFKGIIKFGYWDSPMEIEARSKEND